MMSCSSSVWSNPDIDALDLAGELVIDAAEDAGRVGDERVGAGAAEVVGREPFEDLVRDAVGGGERDLERRASVTPVPSRSDGGDLHQLGVAPDLVRGAVDQRDADAQAAQQGDVEQQVGEVVVLDDGAVDGDDEHAVAEPRDVPQDFAEVGQPLVHRVVGRSVRGIADREFMLDRSGRCADCPLE